MNKELLEVQLKVRENAVKFQEELKSLKTFENDMKLKEQEMLKEAAKEVVEKDNAQTIPIRSNIEDFQKFHIATEESSYKTQMKEGEIWANPKEEANAYKEKGNEMVKTKDYEAAIKFYSLAIATLSNEAVYYSNRSQCFINLGKFAESVEDTKKAIELDRKNAKAYYRQMTSYEKMSKDLEALKTCQSWMEALPDDQMAKTNYDRIHNKIIEENVQKKRAKIKWSKYSEQTNFVEKKPHLQSKKPLKPITVHPKKSQSPIPDNIIDKIFNNSTGEHVPEPETNSQLFKSNFLLDKNYAKPKPVKSTTTTTTIEDTADEKSKVNEKNEILKAAASENVAKKATLEELDALKNHLIVLPTTGPQFFAAWKELNEDLKFLYLKNIAGSCIEFGSLLGAQLDSDMLADIINVTYKYFLHYKIPYIQLLFSLSKNSEISILAMFIEDEDKKKLNEMLSVVLHGGDNNVNNMIQQIKQNFQI